MKKTELTEKLRELHNRFLFIQKTGTTTDLKNLSQAIRHLVLTASVDRTPSFAEAELCSSMLNGLRKRK